MSSAVGLGAFCTNCGYVAPEDGLCSSCHWDPVVPVEVLDAHRAVSNVDEHLLVYPGEQASLVWATIVTVGLVIGLTTATAGLALVVITALLATVRLSEQASRANLLRVSQTCHSQVHKATKVAAFRLGMRAPEVYVSPDDEPRAYTGGVAGRHWIVLSTRLLEMLTPSEMLFVIGRELGHIRQRHPTWLVLTSSNGALGTALAGPVLRLIFGHWLLRAQYSADRAGLVACHSLRLATKALLTMHYWHTPANVDRMLDEWSQSRHSFETRFAELLEDSPFVLNRLLAMEKFGSLLQKRGLL